MYKKYPGLVTPNDNMTIWRYMDFTKFVSLVDKSALFFSRADKLGDPFEGSYSRANVNLRPTVYKDKIPQDALRRMSGFSKILPKFTVINCWHINEYESAALWGLYLKGREGIAIRSTFDCLKGCLKDEGHHIFIGKVKYIDYEKDWLLDLGSMTITLKIKPRRDELVEIYTISE